MNASANAGVFFISERRVKAVWFSLFVFGLGALFYAWRAVEHSSREIGAPWWLWALAALSFAFISFHRAWVLAHRERPVVRIGDEEIEWGSTYYFSSKRHRVPFRDLRSISWKSPNVIGLATQAGDEIAMRIAEIAKDERPALFESISSRLEGDSKPQP